MIQASWIANAAKLPLTVLKLGAPDEALDYLADSLDIAELVSLLRQKAVRLLLITTELAASYPELVPTVLRKTMSSVVICH